MDGEHAVGAEPAPGHRLRLAGGFVYGDALYEGADHGFLAYTRPYYRPADAQVSWKRTVAFLRRHL